MTETEIKKRGIQEKSNDTLVIENRLRTSSVGELVTYDDLSKLLGRDVRVHCIGNLTTARRVLRDEKIFFVTVRGDGVRRISQEEAVNCLPDHSIKRAKSAARQGIKCLRNIEYDQLSEDGKKKHLSSSAQLGAIELFSSAKATKKIEGKVGDSPIPIGETLKLFGG